MSAQLIPYLMGGALLVVALYKLKVRLELSRAKHPSLRGHARIGAWIARHVPFYDYDDARVFRSDDAPAEIADRRRSGFMRLARLYEQRFAETRKLTDDTTPGLSDLQFTGAYRVPFQYSRFVRQHLRVGAFYKSSSGVTLTDLDGNVFYDLTGSYGVNVFGNDFYKECMDRGSARARELGPALGGYHVVDRRQRPASARAVRAGRGVVPHVGHGGGHAGGAAGALSHAAHAPGAVLRRLPRLVGRRAAGRRQPVARARDLHAQGHARRFAARVAHAPRHRLRAGEPAAGACIRTPTPPTTGRWSTAPGARTSTGRPTPTGCASLREVCTKRGIVLIFDEVFVGFRLARGGAQEYFGVAADMVTYGKTLGGGFPVGVLCGKARFMKRFREKRPADICFARGTFNSHPYVMAAMNEFLQQIDRDEIKAMYQDLDRTWNDRVERLNRRLAEEKLPVRVANLSTIWTVTYTQPSRYNWMFQYYLRAEGLALSWVGTGRFIFSLNYTDDDFQAVADRFVAAARAMQGDGYWWLNVPTQQRSDQAWHPARDDSPAHLAR